MGLFARPKHLALQPAQIQAKVSDRDDGTFGIRLTSAAPAPWTRLEVPNSEVRFSDNFVHLDPALPLEVTVKTLEGVTLSTAQLQQELMVTALIDTAV